MPGRIEQCGGAWGVRAGQVTAYNGRLVASGASRMIAVVIPCYRVSRHILDVIAGIGNDVGLIIVVDDACPDGSGRLVQQQCSDPRVTVVFNERNLGVGGAVKAGYRVALERGASVIVKLDGDGQMDAALIPQFVAPILEGKADYTKGNRFFDVQVVNKMPAVRLFGNTMLSFITKLSSGYWNLFDPTNGYTAISARIVPYLDLDKIADSYFFESDMLFRLNILRAAVADIPMDAIYGDEESNLRIMKVLPTFIASHLRNFFKRIFYNYFIRDFSYASIELLAGIVLLAFGTTFGIMTWIDAHQKYYASAGTVMLFGMSMIIGVQMLLGFLQYDITHIPTVPLQNRLRHSARPQKD
jgi:dolichol-phosphate mannosyltransferase